MRYRVTFHGACPLAERSFADRSEATSHARKAILAGADEAWVSCPDADGEIKVDHYHTALLNDYVVYRLTLDGDRLLDYTSELDEARDRALAAYYDGAPLVHIYGVEETPQGDVARLLETHRAEPERAGRAEGALDAGPRTRLSWLAEPNRQMQA